MPPETSPATRPASDGSSLIGKPMDRVDGRAKVTGAARYAAEAEVARPAHAVIVQSTIARGEVLSIDAAAAERSPGVLAVVTPANVRNFCALKQPDSNFFTGGVPGESRLPLSDMLVHYAGQHLAVVVADTPERARAAAAEVAVRYRTDAPVLNLDDPAAQAVKPDQFFGEALQTRRGDVEAALAAPDLVVVRQTYTTPVESHNPMEPSATVAAWDGDQLTLYDSTQYVLGSRAVVADTFGIPRDKVRTVCPFVGGGFGCKGFQWPHTILAAIAARAAGRPVRLALTRAQMFTSCGHRPPTVQAMTLAAARDGRLAAIRHETTIHGSLVGEHVEACGLASSRLLYACANVETPHTIRKVNVGTPTPMRAPGECPGTFALESAMDELAYALAIDPVELRLVNHADVHPATGMPWSSKHLKACYRVGAEKFGWKGRDPKPRSMRDAEGRLVGWGMATATYPGYRFPSAALIRLIGDGRGGVRAVAAAAAHDLGTGAYTVFTQITAAALGLPPEKVQVLLGDSSLPPAPVAGGSNTTASVGHALSRAADVLKSKLAEIAAAGDSPLKGMGAAQLVLRDETLAARDDASKSVPLADLLARSGQPSIDAIAIPPGNASPNHVAVQAESGGEDFDGNQRKYAFQSFGCHFVEVKVDEPLARVRVTRVVSVIDNGRVINHKTSRSQVVGGVTMGIGMSLMEETAYDPRTGRPVTDNLADYAVPTNADVAVIEAHFIDEPDPHINALGCRGVGEIGITGVAAAVANAVHHATGRRVRDLPIVPEKLLGAGA